MNILPALALDWIALYLMERRIKTVSSAPHANEILPVISSRNELEAHYSPPGEEISPAFTRSRRKKGIEESDFSFSSPLPSGIAENDTVRGRFYSAGSGRNRPTVIFLHGWMMDYYLLYGQICAHLARRGIEAFLPELPYHHHRRPPGTFSGQFFLLRDFRSTADAIRQAVAETRALAGWVKNQNPKRSVGIMGMSLGGWVGGLTTVLEKRLDFSILTAPAAEPAIMLKGSRLGASIRKGRNWDDRKLFEDFCRMTSPGNYSPAIDGNRILLTENIHDRFIPAGSVERLHRAWEGSRIIRHRHGHISVLYSRRYRKEAAEFILESIQR